MARNGFLSEYNLSLKDKRRRDMEAITSRAIGALGRGADVQDQIGAALGSSMFEGFRRGVQGLTDEELRVQKAQEIIKNTDMLSTDSLKQSISVALNEGNVSLADQLSTRYSSLVNAGYAADKRAIAAEDRVRKISLESSKEQRDARGANLKDDKFILDQEKLTENKRQFNARLAQDMADADKPNIGAFKSFDKDVQQSMYSLMPQNWKPQDGWSSDDMIRATNVVARNNANALVDEYKQPTEKVIRTTTNILNDTILSDVMGSVNDSDKTDIIKAYNLLTSSGGRTTEQAANIIYDKMTSGNLGTLMGAVRGAITRNEGYKQTTDMKLDAQINDLNINILGQQIDEQIIPQTAKRLRQSMARGDAPLTESEMAALKIAVKRDLELEAINNDTLNKMNQRTRANMGR